MAASLASEPSEQNVCMTEPLEGRENTLRAADCANHATINKACLMYVTFEL